MKRMTKPIALALLVAVGVTTIMSGCGSSGSNPSSVASNPASTIAASDSSTAISAATSTDLASQPPVTLTWYYGGPGPEPDDSTVFAAVNNLIKAKINATVNWIPVTFGTYNQQMSTIIASGQNYDLCYTANWMNSYVANVATGAFTPLDELLQKDAPQTYASVPQIFWNAVKIGGKIYGVVNQQVSARAASIIIPQDDATKYGFDQSSYVPGDLSSLTPYLAKVYAAIGNDQYANIDITSVPEYLGQDWIGGYAVPGCITATDNSLQVYDQWESPGMLKLIDLLYQWGQAGYMNTKARQTLPDDSSIGDARTHKYTIHIGGTYKPGDAAYEETAYGYPWVELGSNTPILSTGGIQATLTAISATSKNPDRAMQLIELMNTDQDIYMTINYGIKDTHWTTDANGQLIAGPQNSKYNPQVPWELATNYLAVPQAGQPADVWQQTKDFNNNAIASQALGFSFDTTPVKTQIAACAAVLSTSAIRQISVGALSPDQYQSEIVSKLKAAGSDQIITEMQKQLTAWKAGFQ